jgi:beta-N-acetylhexosaminidase
VRGRLVPPLCLLTASFALALSAPAASSVEDAVAQMSLREKVGQLVMFGTGGHGLTEHERAAIPRHHLGGVILFARNYEDRSQLTALTAQIQRVVRRGNELGIGSLISVDQEGGVVKRFPDMPPWRSAPEMGRIGKDSVAYDQGRATGRHLKDAGVNVNLAPVADLDLPPSHVMRSRSFGSRPHRVGRLVRAFTRGMQSKRVAGTGKHFPGLGGGTINTDQGRSYVRRTKWQLHNVDAVPFHRAIGGGIKLMMVSHAMYVNDGGYRPASLHRYIAGKRLRGEFGYTGVAISDALEAVAWRFDGNVARACKATIQAGVDIALITGGVDRAQACAWQIRKGVKDGDISMARIDRAVERVLRLKAWLGVFDPSRV